MDFMPQTWTSTKILKQGTAIIIFVQIDDSAHQVAGGMIILKIGRYCNSLEQKRNFIRDSIEQSQKMFKRQKKK